MKKIRIVSASLMLFLITTVGLSTEVFALKNFTEATNQYPIQTRCIRTSDGTVVGYANDCSNGGNGCVDHDC